MVVIKNFEELQSTDLGTLVYAKFEDGVKSGVVQFNEPKEVELVDDGQCSPNLKIELKVIESSPEKSKSTQKKDDPFVSPDEHLVVVETLLDDYKLLLNKFPVSPNHFLLTTKEFRKQDELLNGKELAIIHEITKNLNNADKKNDNFFAFYNGGPNSGYSQQHKHVQFLPYPLQNMNPFPEYVIKGHEFSLPKDQDDDFLQDDTLPFKHFISLLPTEFDSLEDQQQILSMVYISLFRKLLNFFKQVSLQKEPQQKEDDLPVKPMPISYNLMMTQNFMMVVPRNEAFYPEEQLPVNAVAFLGLLLARNENQKKLIKQDGSITKILSTCGFPSDMIFDKETEFDY